MTNSGDNKMFTTKKVITPELAKFYLSKNTSNRKIRNNHVDRLACAMTNGEWIETHQGIAISVNGDLIDGQHRLLAVVKSGVSINTLVSVNVNNNSFLAIDIGTKRNMSDCLRVPKNRIQVSSLLTRILSVNNSTTPDQVSIVHRNIADYIEELVSSCQSTSKYFSSAPIRLAAVMRIIENENNSNYIINTYRDLVLNKIVELPSVAQAFVGQTISGKISSRNVNDFFSRAWVVFDKKRSNISKIQITETTKNVKEATDLYYSYFEKLPWMK